MGEKLDDGTTGDYHSLQNADGEQNVQIIRYQLRRLSFLGSVLGAAMLTVASLAPQSAAQSVTLNTLHSFTPSGGTAPLASLIMDASGHLYGTAANSGIGCCGGTVFELIPNATKTEWKEKVLYSFCTDANCTDGQGSSGSLIMDTSGNLYGTTGSGGAYNEGTVFELIPNASKTEWKEKVLYSFCAQAQCIDGRAPAAGLVIDGSGNLYGTTVSGGAHAICDSSDNCYGGTVFKLTPNAAKTAWTETVLHSFCAQGGVNCTDGADPYDKLIITESGKLYGTTFQGGSNSIAGGTVFELSPDADNMAWRHKILYSFCALTNCADGSYVYAGLLRNGENLYGTTEGGTVFELSPNTAKTAWTYTVLYSFQGDADGIVPTAGVVMDSSGNLYGTTEAGGAYSYNGGTVYKLTPPNAGSSAWTHTILYSFCAQGSYPDCTDGYQPWGGLLIDAGQLYGTTVVGGADNLGTVFELPP